MNKHDQTDVIIVGGGPVGIGLAIDLAMSGVSSIIIERHQTQSVTLHLFHERTGAAE
jgi:2-polyprenyl-6-methoxyphenol hydroxylase-like FAD-dependent oxidoreductase